MRWQMGCFLGLLGLVLLTACSSTAPRYNLMLQENLGYNWWRVSFKNHWATDTEPLWYRDALIAHQIVAPALEQNRETIKFWRFHRRAARDNAGHRFSFLFYAPVETAHEVYQTLQRNELLAELTAGGQLEQVDYDDLAQMNATQIHAHSDKSWSPAVQESWIYFIMGASEMWLQLIDRLAKQHQDASSNESLYQTVNQDLNRIWQTEGSHALLHHLNALYGYQPLFIDEQTALRF